MSERLNGVRLYSPNSTTNRTRLSPATIKFHKGAMNSINRSREQREPSGTGIMDEVFSWNSRAKTDDERSAQAYGIMRATVPS